MVSRVTATIDLDISNDAHVGDEFGLLGDVRITLIREPYIDVTRYGHKTETLAGEREYELLITNVRLATVVPA